MTVTTRAIHHRAHHVNTSSIQRTANRSLRQEVVMRRIRRFPNLYHRGAETQTNFNKEGVGEGVESVLDPYLGFMVGPLDWITTARSAA